MPSRNIIKYYNVDTYYHIYNRGVDKCKIFIDDEDYSVFLNLFKRYLSDSPAKDNEGREYFWLAKDVELTAFCLMPNHFHLLLYQIKIGAATRLLRSVCSAYVTYFNNKYNRVGALFQGKFKAASIKNYESINYITRYIHRNPNNYLEWEWSSLCYWLDEKQATWVCPQRLRNISRDQYLRYITDKENYAAKLDSIKDVAIDI